MYHDGVIRKETEVKTSKPIKITLSISSKMFEKINLKSESLDLTPNTFLKQCAIAYINNVEIDFLNLEHHTAIKEFHLIQVKLLETLKKLEEKTANGEQLEVNKVRQYFKYYKEDFDSLIHQLSQKDSK
jgi:predicted nucleotidyltransferase